jgi:VanZ family protein
MLKANDLHKVTRLDRLSTYFQSTGVRWALTLTWTVLAASLLLSPSGNGTTVSWLSKLFCATETTDAIGHVFNNTILSVLWCWTTNPYTSSTPRTTYLILFGGIVWCFGAELSQVFVPGRGTSLLDLAANILGVSVGLLVYRLLALR